MNNIPIRKQSISLSFSRSRWPGTNRIIIITGIIIAFTQRLEQIDTISIVLGTCVSVLNRGTSSQQLTTWSLINMVHSLRSTESDLLLHVHMCIEKGARLEQCYWMPGTG